MVEFEEYSPCLPTLGPSILLSSGEDHNYSLTLHIYSIGHMGYSLHAPYGRLLANDA